MKKGFYIAAIMVLLLLITLFFKQLGALWGTEDKKNQDKQYEDIGKDSDSLPRTEACKFKAQYSRTNGYHEGVEYPIVKIIRSVDELKAYYEANQGRYHLGRKDAAYANEPIGFLDACDRYDEAYFEEQMLILVLLEEGSGSVRHEVKSVELTEEDGKTQMTIRIDSITPDICTDDMAEWHIFIEPEKGVDIGNEEDVIVSH